MSDTRESQNLFPTEHEISALARTISYARLPLDKLALPQELYDDAALSQPLPSAQLLSPLLVSGSGPGIYVIMDGCKRFACLRRENRPECACGIVPSLNPLQEGLVRILCNRGRTLSIREQFLFFNWLKTCAGIKEKSIVNRFMDLSWNQMTDLDEVLLSPADVQNAVFENRLHAQNTPDFRLLSEKDRKDFLDAFKGLGLSLQTEREFIQWMSDIAHAQKSSITGFPGFKEIETVINDTTLNAPQKIQKTGSILHSLRLPGYDAALKTWKKLVHEVNPAPSKITFIPSPFFEKNRLEVRLVFSRPQEVMETLKKLAGIPEATWSRLIKPF